MFSLLGNLSPNHFRGLRTNSPPPPTPPRFSMGPSWGYFANQPQREQSITDTDFLFCNLEKFGFSVAVVVWLNANTFQIIFARRFFFRRRLLRAGIVSAIAGPSSGKSCRKSTRANPAKKLVCKRGR